MELARRAGEDGERAPALTPAARQAEQAPAEEVAREMLLGDARRARNALLAVTASLTLALSHAAAASPDAPAKDEIDHLLNFVAASSCTFVRNGTEYPSDKAREHLATKYQFAGSRISTAEEFIRYLATQSELYHVKCGKADALSGVWLTNELKHYRETPRLQHVSR